MSSDIERNSQHINRRDIKQLLNEVEQWRNY